MGCCSAKAVGYKNPAKAYACAIKFHCLTEPLLSVLRRFPLNLYQKHTINNYRHQNRVHITFGAIVGRRYIFIHHQSCLIFGVVEIRCVLINHLYLFNAPHLLPLPFLFRYEKIVLTFRLFRNTAWEPWSKSYVQRAQFESVAGLLLLRIVGFANFVSTCALTRTEFIIENPEILWDATFNQSK